MYTITVMLSSAKPLRRTYIRTTKSTFCCYDGRPQIRTTWRILGLFAIISSRNPITGLRFSRSKALGNNSMIKMLGTFMPSTLSITIQATLELWVYVGWNRFSILPPPLNLPCLLNLPRLLSPPRLLNPALTLGFIDPFRAV